MTIPFLWMLGRRTRGSEAAGVTRSSRLIPSWRVRGMRSSRFACRLPDSNRDRVLVDISAREARSSSVQPRLLRSARSRAPMCLISSTMIVFPPAPEAFFLLILQELLHNCKPGADYGGMREEWEVIIVGGGVAGLSAALALGWSAPRVLVVDAGAARIRFAAHGHGMLGNAGLEPAGPLRRGREEVGASDVTVRTGRISSPEEAAAGLVVAFD